MPEPDLAPRRWTAADARALNEATTATRHECVDGLLLVTPSPSLDHQEVVGRLYVALLGYLARERVGHVFVAPVDVELEPGSLLQLDLVVTPLHDGARPRGRQVDAILLAVEVLSPSTARHDRLRKRRFHQRVGTPEYWVVDPDIRAIERSRAGDARVEVVDAVLEWQPEGATTPFALDVAAFLAAALDA